MTQQNNRLWRSYVSQHKCEHSATYRYIWRQHALRFPHGETRQGGAWASRVLRLGRPRIGGRPPFLPAPPTTSFPNPPIFGLDFRLDSGAVFWPPWGRFPAAELGPHPIFRAEIRPNFGAVFRPHNWGRFSFLETIFRPDFGAVFRSQNWGRFPFI